MARIEHVACGFSPFAPGCDEAPCLMRRIDYARTMAWSTHDLQQRLDARIDRFLDETLAGADAESAIPHLAGHANDDT
jgi:hypothetical protein